jgi:hypothetical protein
MRKLLLRLVAFAAIFTVALPWAILRFDLVRLHEALGKEVWEALRNAEKTVQPKLDVVLGDSVAHQIYREGQESGQFWSLASNQAITIVGQWILLRKFAEHNDMRGRRVSLVVSPGVFSNELRSSLTFHYFLKPFYWSADDPDLSPLVRERIRDIPLSWTALVPIVKLSRWSPVPRVRDGDGPIGPVAVEYLRRMRDLGRERGFTVKVIAPFMTLKTKSAFDEGAFRQAVERASLEDLFDRYYLRVLPDEAFGPGGVHLTRYSLEALPDNPLAL